MSTDRLYIEDQEVDLAPSTAIAITMQINDLAELIDRQSNYTNQFTVPRTARNRAIFENADLLQSGTEIPYRKLKARLIKQGIEIVPDGYAIVEGSGEFYNVTVYGGLVDFWKLIEGKKLKDLNLSAYNHQWNITSIYGSRANTNGYIYPIVDFDDSGTQFPTANANIDLVKAMPFFFAHTILTQIAAEAGFTLVGDFLQDANFKNLLVQLGAEKLTASGVVIRATKTTGAQSYGDSFLADDDGSGNAVTRTGNFDITGEWSTIPVGSLWLSLFQFATDKQIPSEYEIRYEGTVDYSVGNFGGGYIQIEARIVGLMLFSYRTPYIPNGNGSIPVGFDIPPGKYSAGDTIDVAAIWVGGFGGVLRWGIGSFVEVKANTPTQIGYTDPVQIAENLPDMTQAEFMKTIAQLFGLMYKPNTISGTVEIASFKILGERISEAIDWTHKLHEAKDGNGNYKYDISYRVGSYAQKNYLRWKEDDDVTQYYGDGIIEIEDETLPEEKTIFTLPFAATESHTVSVHGITVPWIKRWTGGTPGTASLVRKPRLLLLNRIAAPTFTPPFQWWYPPTGFTQPINDNLPLCRFVDSDFAENLAFDNTIVDRYYSTLRGVLNKTKKVTAYFKLNASEVANIDHYTPVYLQQFSSYFYVNKIENFVSDDRLTRAELIRIGADAQVERSIKSDNLILNPDFQEPGEDANGNAFLKNWLTVYKSWEADGSGGVVHIANNDDELTQALQFNTEFGSTYEFKFEILGMTSQRLDAFITGAFPTPGTFVAGIPWTAITGDGIYTLNFIANGTEDTVHFMPDFDFDGMIRNVSLRKI